MRNKKRILSITVKRMIDESPDTSHLGEYGNSPTSEYSIDRKHALDCPVNNKPTEAIEKLEQIIFHLQNERRIAGEDSENTEWESLDESIDALIALQDELAACTCDEHGDMERNQYRYFNPSFNYVDKTGNPSDGLTPEDVRKYTRQDYERMERLNAGDWSYIGIRAEAKVISNAQGKGEVWSGVVQRVSSGGLWGIESDSDRDYLESVEKDELANLRDELKALGFSSRAISTAFKNVERKDS